MDIITPLMNSWYALLNGVLTYGGQDVQVVMDDDEVEEITTDNYVLLRCEGGNNVGNKRAFVDSVVIITDVVTMHTNNIKASVADDIDGQIAALIKTSPPHIGLGAQSWIQIVRCDREGWTYLREQDDTNKYYRKVSRYGHRILQNELVLADSILTETGDSLITEDGNLIIIE